MAYATPRYWRGKYNAWFACIWTIFLELGSVRAETQTRRLTEATRARPDFTKARYITRALNAFGRQFNTADSNLEPVMRADNTAQRSGVVSRWQHRFYRKLLSS